MGREEQVFAVGDIIAERYEIKEELGRGAYGVVFRAIQLGIDRDVAIKTLLPEMAVGSEEHKRFEREALVVSRFNHPHIVTLFDYGEHEGVLFMVMEYIDGRNIRDLIDAEAPLAPERVRTLTYQMLDALQYAHDQGVVHRDLKPENIQLLKNPSMDVDESDAIKILDFGIAKFVHGEIENSPLNTLTQSGTVMGTPQYMSPENVTGDPVTHHADLYAVGLVMYEMLMGEPAFVGDSPHEVMVSHIKDEAPTLGEGPELATFSRALSWALRKQPDERVPSAREFRQILEEDEPKAVPAAVSAVASEESKVLKPLAAVAAAASIVIVLLVLVIFQGGFSSDVPDDEPITMTDVDRVSEHPAEPRLGADASPSGPDNIDDRARRLRDDGEEMVEDETVDEEQAGPIDERPATGEQDQETVQPPAPEPAAAAQESEEPEVTTEYSQADSDESEPADEHVTLEILSTPGDARVTIDDRPVGTSPLEYQVTRGDEPLEIGFSLMGYDDTVESVVPDASKTLEVRLRRGRLHLD